MSCQHEVAAYVVAKASPSDFAETPIYVVYASECDRFLPAMAYAELTDQCLAFTHEHLDEQLRPFLESRKQWRGRGVVCVLFPERLKARSMAEKTEAGIGAVVHEVAHWLDTKHRPATAGSEPGRYNAEHVAEVVQDPVWQGYYRRPAPAAEGHGASFIRAALHLWHRTNAIYPLPVGCCWIAGENYGLSCPTLYADALAAELRSMNDKSIGTILLMRPPEAFVKLWLRDREAALA